MLVDDETDVLEFLALFLESHGWEVTSASSVPAAMQALEQRHYFLVQTDIAMPDMDGYEFITLLKEKGVASQVALMTGFGYNPNHTLVKINKTLHYPVLFKPFDCAKVIDTVVKSWQEYNREFLAPDEEPPKPKAPQVPLGPCGPGSTIT
ncbi:MAG: response regulator [Chitinispirillaceae bacterium]|nr:response regulator [Chitinispirillaceae bacterium]